MKKTYLLLSLCTFGLCLTSCVSKSPSNSKGKSGSSKGEISLGEFREWANNYSYSSSYSKATAKVREQVNDYAAGNYSKEHSYSLEYKDGGGFYDDSAKERILAKEFVESFLQDYIYTFYSDYSFIAENIYEYSYKNVDDFKRYLGEDYMPLYYDGVIISEVRRDYYYFDSNTSYIKKHTYEAVANFIYPEQAKRSTKKVFTGTLTTTYSYSS